jgi:cellulose synthase/poly-beta-1,6-N-acetylglucosamine synthase-like glycosyltransferase
MYLHILFFVFLAVDWLLALLWVASTLTALRMLPHIPDILNEKYAAPIPPSQTPLISVIVPARNEAEDVEAGLRSLLAIDSVAIEIIAIDDRSTDATGEIMDRLAVEAGAAGKTLRVLHVAELPPGWMGKTHAMALAARQASAPWLLFTDADIFFAKDALLRALNLADAERADHVVIFPTLVLKTFGERMMIAFFQGIAALASRFWKIPDPKAKESIGVGAFNMVRADVYRAMGGFEALRMEVVEDLRFGFEVKRQGFRQRVAFGRDLVRVRWAVGATGVIRNITKNFFAIFRFRVGVTVAVCCGLLAVCAGPFAACVGPMAMRIPALVVLLMLVLLYRYYRRFTGISTAYALTFPIAACMVVYSILRSMAVTLARGGVRWRGTLYPLAELRKNAGPLR